LLLRRAGFLGVHQAVDNSNPHVPGILLPTADFDGVSQCPTLLSSFRPLTAAVSM